MRPREGRGETKFLPNKVVFGLMRYFQKTFIFSFFFIKGRKSLSERESDE
jgi:hypothetical protein